MAFAGLLAQFYGLLSINDWRAGHVTFKDTWLALANIMMTGRCGLLWTSSLAFLRTILLSRCSCAVGKNLCGFDRLVERDNIVFDDAGNGV